MRQWFKANAPYSVLSQGSETITFIKRGDRVDHRRQPESGDDPADGALAENRNFGIHRDLPGRDRPAKHRPRRDRPQTHGNGDIRLQSDVAPGEATG